MAPVDWSRACRTDRPMRPALEQLERKKLSIEMFVDEQLSLHGRPVQARVFRSESLSELQAQQEEGLVRVRGTETLLLRWPPPILGNIVGQTPLGKPVFETHCPALELWHITGLGSYDQIRLAWECFSSPSREYVQPEAGGINTLMAEMKTVFSEGSFRLINVSGALLQCSFCDPDRRVTRSERTLLDRVNSLWFRGDSTGHRMKQVHLSGPDGFVVGAV